MKNRTGNYVAFDGCGETDPTKSDMLYYAILKAWTNNDSHNFSFVNSHEKTYSVLDTSLDTTLKNRIKERLSLSKNIFIILSDKTRKAGSMLSYEIEQAVDVHKLPLIITYIGYDVVLNPIILEKFWPTSLKTRLENGTAKAMHIPFVQSIILDSIKAFNLQNMPSSSYENCSNLDHFIALNDVGILDLKTNRIKKTA